MFVMELKGRFTSKNHETMIPPADEAVDAGLEHASLEVCEIPELQSDPESQFTVKAEIELKFGKFFLGATY